MKRIENAFDFPDKQHYAIIIFDSKSVYHEGDQRSKDSPGHGYPAHTEKINSFQYLSYLTKDVWEQDIKKFYKEKPNRKDVVFFIGQPKGSITTEILINL